jgi:aspartyl-tRNA(Asn)/glutamyl-tRNA(Gln) amidotransferase subunit A
MHPTVASLAAHLAAGRTTSVELTKQALSRIDDPNGEGARAFITVYRESAIAAAEASDRLRSFGVVPSPLAGIPISIKDLFDVRGEVTRAGSVVLAGAAPAAADAVVVARLRAAGAILVGRTNMTEFAYGGLGLNPHYGTPGCPADRTRIPGGSSSGGGVSVADGMAVAAIGSDTGGSVRIPAAFCGVTGFKPTQPRVPRDGVFPLSWEMDSIGPLAVSVACCAMVDAAMAGEPVAVPALRPLALARFALPRAPFLDGLDVTVGKAFESALTALSHAGAKIVQIEMPKVDEILSIRRFIPIEAYAHHRATLAAHAERFDPMVRMRLQDGAQSLASEFIALKQVRRELIARCAALTFGFDAVLMPTVAVVPPNIADVGEKRAYLGQSALVTRLTSVGNCLDRCAISLPCPAPGSLPVGITLMGEHGADLALLSTALGVEAMLAREISGGA